MVFAASAPVVLPIDRFLPEIIGTLEQRNRLVLQAAPGAGKTTRVPAALLKAEFIRSGKAVLVLEPRRLAAKWAAVRVAGELGEQPGNTVGYRFRFESVGNAKTRLRFVTEGMFSRMLLEDPTLGGIGAVVLDEFHERHIHSDFALAYIRRLQEAGRSDLRLIVMSATLDTDALCKYLGCPLIQVEGRQFPVEIEYLHAPPAKSLEWTVREEVACALASKSGRGDLLVFLPGMAEIRKCAESLAGFARDAFGTRIAVLPLHGELSREDQDRVMRKTSERRVILSTNIAETSLTIDGVDTIIDSGLHRIASNSWWSGLPALRTRPISRASAAQRAGRAGRTGPGKCIRLYTRGDHDSRAPFELPEVLRLDLAQPLLELISLGIGDLVRFPWFEAPPKQALEAACELLYRLGALKSATNSGELTDLGKRLARVPAHPRIARMLLEAEKLNVACEASELAALITEGSLSQGDHGHDALKSLAKARLTDRERRVRDQLVSSLRGRDPKARDASFLKSEVDSRIARAVLSGFPDRVAKKRSLGGSVSRGHGAQIELLFSAGGSALLELAVDLVGDEYFVVLEAQENQGTQHLRSRTLVRSLCPIRSEWLFDLEPGLLEETDELEWDQQRRRAMQVSRMMYGELVLLESREPAKPGPAVFKVIVTRALGIDPTKLRELRIRDWIGALEPLVSREVSESCLARISLLARYVPELTKRGLRDPLNCENVFSCFEPLFRNKAGLQEYAETDWFTELPLAFGYPVEDLHRIEEWVPQSVTLPSGRRAKVHYSLDQAPWIESRLQDFFGWEEGPSLFRGQLPMVLKLLAPNQRPVQVTTDLKSFWQCVYPELRGQLSRRYPKHAWPENPMIPRKSSAQR